MPSQPLPKMSIPKPLLDLLETLQKAWEPLCETEQKISFKEFKGFTKKQGIQDRKNNPEVYLKNACQILDYYIFSVAMPINGILLNYDLDPDSYSIFLRAALEINSYVSDNIEPATFYLDETNCVPILVGTQSVASDLLYKKMQLYYWFLNKVEDFLQEQTQQLLVDPNKAVISHLIVALIKKFIHGDPTYKNAGWEKISFWAKKIINNNTLIPQRYRFTTIEKQLDEYAKKNNIKPMTLQEIEQAYVLPKTASTPRSAASTETPKPTLTKEELYEGFKMLTEEENAIHTQLEVIIKKIEDLKKSIHDDAIVVNNLGKKLSWRAFCQAQPIINYFIEQTLEDTILLTNIENNKKIIQDKRTELELSLQKLNESKESLDTIEKSKLIVATQINKLSHSKVFLFQFIKKIQKKVKIGKKERDDEQHLTTYQGLYTQQEKTRRWKTVLAILLSIISGGLLAFPAYFLWRHAKQQELIQAIKITPAYYKIIKQLRHTLYGKKPAYSANTSSPVEKTSVANKPRKAVEKQSDPQQSTIFYMDKEQANRFRFFEAQLHQQTPLPLTADKMQALQKSKEKSASLMAIATASYKAKM